jgi:hypothetical protein
MENLELLIEIVKYYSYELSIIGIIVLFFFVGYGLDRMTDKHNGNDD